MSRLRNFGVAAVKKFPNLDSYLLRKRFVRHAKNYSKKQNGLEKIIGQAQKVDDIAPKTQIRVLVATSTGGHRAAMEMELLLSAALKLRGSAVVSLLCDGILPACQLCEPRLFPNLRAFSKNGPKDICGACIKSGKLRYNEIGVTSEQYSKYLHVEDYLAVEKILNEIAEEDIEKFSIDNIPIGEHAKSGALRFFATGTLPEAKYAPQIYKRYFKAALLTHRMINNFLDKVSIDVAVFHHGIYVPQGVLTDTLKSRGVRVVNWNVAYRKNSFIFSHGETYHHSLMNEASKVWENIDFTIKLEKKLDKYLDDRKIGAQDWISFVGDPVFGTDNAMKKLGCDPSKRKILCLSNVIWDAQLHYPQNAFKSMLEWLSCTIEFFKNRPDLELIIRIHPAEIRGSVPSRQPLEREIRSKFPNLPSNIFIVKPTDRISTYTLSDMCDSALIYGTKMGVELAAKSIPVIVAGEAWVRNKGITVDVKSEEEYYERLMQLPFDRKMDEEQTERAKKYAYHFFFKRMIPVKCMSSSNKEQPYEFSGSILDLKVGGDPGLDVICDGILYEKPFVYNGSN